MLKTAEVTAEQRLLAWRQMQHPATWPATLEEALRDPTRRKCIDGYACTMGRPAFNAGHPGPAHGLPTPPVPPTPTAPPKPSKARTASGLATWPNQRGRAAALAGGVDRKRAAAGDKDD